MLYPNHVSVQTNTPKFSKLSVTVFTLQIALMANLDPSFGTP
jgi:hypothetical protein